jgi:hypothetical protein
MEHMGKFWGFRMGNLYVGDILWGLTGILLGNISNYLRILAGLLNLPFHEILVVNQQGF